MGFVGVTNFQFVERLVFLKRLRHNLKHTFQIFHARLLRERKCGTFAFCEIANMDQKLLLFVLDDGKTHNEKGPEEVWFISGKSGLDKKQSTIQLSVFVEGIPGVGAIIIFRGESKCVKALEKGR